MKTVRQEAKADIERLKEAVENGDNEAAHSNFDSIMWLIAKRHEPRLLKDIEEITKDTDF